MSAVAHRQDRRGRCHGTTRQSDSASSGLHQAIDLIGSSLATDDEAVLRGRVQTFATSGARFFYSRFAPQNAARANNWMARQLAIPRSLRRPTAIATRSQPVSLPEKRPRLAASEASSPKRK
jgi:hypothetical protein